MRRMQGLITAFCAAFLLLAGCKELILKPTAAFDVVKGYPGNTYSPESNLVVSHYFLPPYQYVVRRGFVEVDLSKVPASFQVHSIILLCKAEPDISGILYVLPVVGQPTKVLQGEWAGPMFDSLGFGETEYGFGSLQKSTVLNESAVEELQTAILTGQGWWAFGLRWQTEITEMEETGTLTNLSVMVVGE